MPLPLVNKNLLDVVQVFQTYLQFNGDVDKTAAALDIDPATIKNLAASENWAAKIEQWSRVLEGDHKDAQIQINRAINYVQSHRARSLLDKVLAYLSEGDAEALIDRLTVNTKHGPEFKTRALTDLIKAMETAQFMTQRALGDTAAERPEDSGSGKKEASIAILVQKAMNAAECDTGLDSVAIVRKQIQEENSPKLLKPPADDNGPVSQ